MTLSPPIGAANPINFQNAMKPVEVHLVHGTLCRSHRGRGSMGKSGLPFCFAIGQTRIIPN